MNLDIISSLLGIVISTITIIIYIKSSLGNSIRKSLLDFMNKLKLTDLSTESDLVKSFNRANDYRNELKNVVSDTAKNTSWISRHEDEYKKLVQSLKSVEESLKSAEVQRFKSDLRIRLEYVIQKKGGVDETYWTSIVDDYDIYINKFHLNSYMRSLYTEAEDLYIDTNIRK